MNEYHYTESGLDNIYLVNGFTVTKLEDDQEIVHINDIHGLHKTIGLILVSKPGLLSGKEIKFIRHTMDLSQTVLARLLGVDYQTVLGWEKDKRDMSKTADHLLRALFFSYINDERGGMIYQKINEIADLDSTLVEKGEGDKIKFEETADEWRAVA